jgi:hypothetical protein
MQISSDGTQQPDPSFSRTVTIGGREVVVEFTRHAHNRMRQRGVLVDEVIDCLRRPDERGLEVDGENRRGVGRYDETGRRMLKVVYERVEDTRYVVISAMWESRPAGGGRR